jgi:hypothetical protein
MVPTVQQQWWEGLVETEALAVPEELVVTVPMGGRDWALIFLMGLLKLEITKSIRFKAGKAVTGESAGTAEMAVWLGMGELEPALRAVRAALAEKGGLEVKAEMADSVLTALQ